MKKHAPYLPALISFLVLLGSGWIKLAAQEDYHRADSLSHVYYLKQSYDTAAVYAHEALRILEEKYGKNDSLYAEMLHKTVYIYYQQGAYEKAIVYSQEETNIRENLQGKSSYEYCISLALLGELYTRSNQYQEALPLFEEALETFEREFGEDDPNYGYFQNNLGWLYNDMGHYDEALPYYIRALDHTKRILGKGHINYAMHLTNLSTLYQEMGRYEDALPLGLEAVDIAEKAWGRENAEYTRCINNLATLYHSMGEYQESLELLHEALEIAERTIGKDHPTYGLRLMNLASEYSNLGRYQEAMPLLLESVENCEKTLGKEHHQYGIRLSNLAELYLTMGKHQEALSLYLEALENTKVALGTEHPSYGNRLGTVATCYYSLGKYEEAESYYLLALENTVHSLGQDHPTCGTRFNDLAMLYKTTGKYDLAIQYYQQALDNTEKTLGKNHSRYGVFLTNLAGTYGNLGKYEDALPLLVEALNLCEEVFGKDHPNYGIQLNKLGSLYRSMGYYEDAIPLLEQALGNCEKIHGTMGPPCEDHISSLAVCYKDMGQYRKALPLYIASMENSEESFGKDHPSYGNSLYKLAGIYTNLGQYQNAIELYQLSLENCEKSLGKAHYQYGLRLNNMAGAYNHLDDHEKALELYHEALRNLESSMGKEHPYYGIYTMNLAAVYKDLEQYDKARVLYETAQSNLEKSLGKTHSYYSGLLINMAALFRATGQAALIPEVKMEQYRQGVPLAMEALEICENSFGTNHPNYGKYQGILASVYRLMAEAESDSVQFAAYNGKAYTLYLEGVENANYQIDQNFAFLSEKEKEAYFNSVSKRFENFSSFALDSKSKFPGITAQVFNNTVRNKGILLKSSTAMRSSILNSGDSTLMAMYGQWVSLKRDIVKNYSIPLARRQADLGQMEAHATILERELVSRSQKFSSFAQTLNTDWTDIQGTLEANEAAIEFVHFRYRADTTMYCALIVTPDMAQPAMVPLCREEELRKILAEQTKSRESINGLYGQDPLASRALYQLIWAPIDSTLGIGNTEKLYISPSGLLHRVSFNAISSDRKLFLCDKYDLEIRNTTAGIITYPGEMYQTDLATATLFGGINYDTDSSIVRVWNYLAGTQSETQKIEKILDRKIQHVGHYSSSTATEELFKEKAGTSMLLHVATHGFFYPDPIEMNKARDKKEETAIPGFGAGLSSTIQGSRAYGAVNYVENENPLMRSGLVFAGANDVWNQLTEIDADDGVLTAEEVIQIDMRKTELVVLSACESGLGDVVGNEGVYGLQRAFKIAGVKHMLISLWQIPDQETEVLMTTFYKKLMKHRDIQTAFVKTQDKMRRKYDPYSWAAFVLIE